MNTLIRIDDRQVQLNISAAAKAELDRREKPLLVEMELYFSCLVRKKVRFSEDLDRASGHSIRLDQLLVSFRPVMTESCSIGDFEDEPPVTDFPIRNPGAFIPHWLHIDYADDDWRGEFGYRSNK